MGNFKRKHRGTIQEFAPTAISEYINRAGDMFTRMQKDREALKNVEISSRLRAELVGRMFIEEDIITSSQLNIIDRNIKKPEYDYKCPNSMWELYNFTTQALRECHPSLWMEKHIKLHDFMLEASNLAVPTTKIIVPSPGERPQLSLFSSNEEINDALVLE